MTTRNFALATTATMSLMLGAGAALAGDVKAEIDENPVFSTFKDWNIKAENLEPFGVNPYYYPFTPGYRFIMELPEHPLGAYRKEVIVLDSTEEFDVRGIGKFKTANIQEEEFFDGVYYQQAYNYFAMDTASNSVYAFGEISWEKNPVSGERTFVGTWKAGEPDGNGMAEPGLLMPGTVNVGAKFIYDGHEAESYGYTEVLETGLTMTVPAGTFDNCIHVREFSLTSRSDITDKWWCKGIGLVKDTSDGELIASDLIPETAALMEEFGKFHDNPGQTTALVAKIDGDQAAEIGVGEIPGKVTSTRIERLGKHNVYTVEIIADSDGTEWDVFVDIETGEIVGTDN